MISYLLFWPTFIRRIFFENKNSDGCLLKTMWWIKIWIWKKKFVKLQCLVLPSFHIIFCYLFQAIIVVSCDTGKIFPPIQCNENGPCPSWTPFCRGTPICRGPVISWICSLQGRTGKINTFLNISSFKVSWSRACWG